VFSLFFLVCVWFFLKVLLQKKSTGVPIFKERCLVCVA
jgi:hypothetical protein